MESNISRDHIALEAMKIILSASVEHKQSLWNKICVLFFGGDIVMNHKAASGQLTAKLAYEYADAMIAEREKEVSHEAE